MLCKAVGEAEVPVRWPPDLSLPVPSTPGGRRRARCGRAEGGEELLPQPVSVSLPPWPGEGRFYRWLSDKACAVCAGLFALLRMGMERPSPKWRAVDGAWLCGGELDRGVGGQACGGFSPGGT